MKKIIFGVVCILLFSCNKRKDVQQTSVSKAKYKTDSISIKKSRSEIKNLDYSQYFKEAKEYCKSNNLNRDKFILIDLGLHSGLKRFFVYDFNQKKILNSYIVSHGCGDNQWGRTSSKEDAPISNEFDSHSSSLGKYVISDRGVSQWGIKVNYLLRGKEKTNSNAVNRAIVLHSWEAVPNDEVYPEGTPEGWGCPAVSNESMTEIDEILKQNKNVLMWIIKSDSN
ncbi:murein L,D-transpeptidase catalytic domain-containing protein [Flavobacterium sp. LC2016-12]|uniref:murein L,D-transpeptidase catalytic domain-containing protein n=1 Tax=Flavobacterium sp. LC2016-12 TaxID=2783794 RepID=UPI00188AFF41|nr:murein L,D-transpeptidase catalytic domain family protein [Flavobacterium sp. LC2016-12]MBF4466520.1 murein L,D-transpeptidase catalytic domain family protein [Flavobacterium sp. LC2016-12]